WRVLGESGEVSRFEAFRSGETPLVGRDEEIELLQRRWERAKSGEGRVVLMYGEPGIGKSRLTAALSEHIETEPHTRLRYFCSPHHQDSALYPFIAQLERAAGFARDDTVEARLGKLRAMLAPGTWDDNDIALLSEMLSLPSSAADPSLSPQRKGEALVQTLAGNSGLTAEIVAEIVERTDGVPLFVEELTKAVLESAGHGDRVAAVLATTSQTALSVPATLHASLMARLDRLGP